MEYRITIGVLAIQGAVEEHMNCVKKCGCLAKEIRVPSDFAGVDGIILPGGESTTMAIVGEKCGLFPVLKEWVQSKRPVWGTCAGMILLSDHAIKQAKGGQSLVGGLDVQVCRNYFGSQVYSQEVQIPILSTILTQCNTSSSSDTNTCSAVFIRAPAILKAGKEVKILGTLKACPHRSALAELQSLLSSTDANKNINQDDNTDDWGFVFHQTNTDAMNPEYEIAVAVQQEDHILATAFHPELTQDLRWHEAFVNMVKAYRIKQQQ